MCADRMDITAQLRSRVGPDIEVIMATRQEARGHSTRLPGTQNAGRQAYDSGPFRFKARATLFLHLAPENSLKPYLGPAYGDTYIHVRQECLTADMIAPGAAVPDDSELICVFGQQTEWQGGYGGAVNRQSSPHGGLRVSANVGSDGGVTCVSPDMSGQEQWQQLIVYRANSTHAQRVSHALGFYLYRHAPRDEAVRYPNVEADLQRWRRSSVFSRRQGPALSVPPPGNQFEAANRRVQQCPDPSDIDC